MRSLLTRTASAVTVSPSVAYLVVPIAILFSSQPISIGR